MQSKYRLDTMVNRVTFDRMIEALQTFVQPMGELVPVSQAVRDVMLYSYPNSMIQVTWQEECVTVFLPLKDYFLLKFLHFTDCTDHFVIQ